MRRKVKVTVRLLNAPLLLELGCCFSVVCRLEEEGSVTRQWREGEEMRMHEAHTAFEQVSVGSSQQGLKPTIWLGGGGRLDATKGRVLKGHAMRRARRAAARVEIDIVVCVRAKCLLSSGEGGGEWTLKPSEAEPNMEEVTNLQMR